MSRSVFVTGGNRGIGLAVARAFAEVGEKVAFTYRTGEPPAELLELGCLAVKCDITNPEQVEQAYKEIEAAHGPVEVLVANAGITRDQLLLRMSEDDFTDVVNTNLTSAYRVAKRASKGMLRARSGRMVFIASAVAMLGEAGQSNYAASKAGLIGFSRSLARELGSRNITCNVVAPGLVDTDMSAALTEERKAVMTGQIPLGRMGRPEEIAAAVLFLAGAEATYVTGAVIPVDGGVGMGH
ncbi:beta-ketoacyl-ACP reductase [Streptomyces sp. UNOB3_S3]|uniref:beta-ketoacyl-ACP reductase n=1 Tax=Streptomyces sp. UNOB3_S3 TaxID=2871682 RepID=UPI001E5F768D|nr:beta-ketoacyl-ACP reductase [Streptomyces sp. UNOB3_S3]MCC3775180.1 beta-ketoacyl-ACP reductase [Streptomyces sp. UNOB3_S3]